jgi:hypothetical protein
MFVRKHHLFNILERFGNIIKKSLSPILETSSISSINIIYLFGAKKVTSDGKVVDHPIGKTVVNQAPKVI